VEVTAVQIAFVAVLFTAGMALAGLFKLINTAAESIRKEMLAEMDKRDASNSKARHDGMNRVATDMLKLEGQIGTLQRETVRREDLQQIETRLTQAIARLDNKMDLVTDKLSGFVALEKQVNLLDARLGRTLSRLEVLPPAPGRRSKDEDAPA
jgi:hypothetical protein